MPGGARARRAHDQHRHAVPVFGVPARPVVSSRQHPGVSALPRAAVHPLAGDQHRARGPRARARHHSRALRRSARHRRIPGAADSRDHREGRPRAESGHDASRHRHHPRRQRSLVCRNGRLLDRAIRRRDGGVGKPARGDLPVAGRQAAHRGHPQLSGLHALPADREPGAPQALHMRRFRKSGDPHVELPAREAGGGGDRRVQPHRGRCAGTPAARR